MVAEIERLVYFEFLATFGAESFVDVGMTLLALISIMRIVMFLPEAGWTQ